MGQLLIGGGEEENDKRWGNKKKWGVQLNVTRARWEGIGEDVLTRWRVTYSLVDVDQELLEAMDWCLSHPKGRKQNYCNFLTRWLRDEQAKGERAQRKRRPLKMKREVRPYDNQPGPAQRASPGKTELEFDKWLGADKEKLKPIERSALFQKWSCERDGREWTRYFAIMFDKHLPETNWRERTKDGD
jgi:hypothetical protein